MQVRAKIMAFDGMKRVRAGQICEVDDRLIKRDEAGNIIRPRWAMDINKPLPLPATTPYQKKSAEYSSAVFTQANIIEEPVKQAPRRGRPPRSSSSASVI